MGRGKTGNTGICPTCQSICTSVVAYGTRELKHYAIGDISVKSIPFITFRCLNADCPKKNFRYYKESDSVELCGKSTYSKSTQNFVVNKLLKHPISYNSFQKQILDDFAVKTSICTLYTWSKNAILSENVPDLSGISVLNTDEKHPLKKK
jgi:hypothetical protein